MPRNTIRINVNVKTNKTNNKQLKFSEIDIDKISNKGIQADEQSILNTSSFGIIEKKSTKKDSINDESYVSINASKNSFCAKLEITKQEHRDECHEVNFDIY